MHLEDAVEPERIFLLGVNEDMYQYIFFNKTVNTQLNVKC